MQQTKYLFIVLLVSIGISSPTDSIYTYGKGTGTFINFYQKYLSAVDGRGNCPMYPSCSQYAKAALQSEGNTFKALCKTCNRVVQCGKDVHSFRIVNTKSGIKYVDLPSSSDEQTFLRNLALPIVSPQSSPSKELLHSLQTGDFLFGIKDYDKAASYYLHLILFAQDTTILSISQVKFLNTVYHSMPLEQFARYYAHLSSKVPLYSRESYLFDYIYASKLYFSGDYNRSLQYVPHTKNGTTVSEELETYMINLRIVNYLKLYKFSDAYKESKKLSSPILPALIEGNQKRYEQNRKNPRTAAFLSAFIPGSGYFYSKKYSTGITAFLVNGLLIWSSTEFFKKRLYGPAIGSSLLGLSMYIGTIGGSSKSAHRYNEQLHQNMTNEIIQHSYFSTPLNDNNFWRHLELPHTTQ